MGHSDDLWLVDTGYQDPLDDYDCHLARREQHAENLGAARRLVTKQTLEPETGQ